MRRLVVAGLVCAVLSPAAHAAPPAVSISAVPRVGAAPLASTLTASGNAVAYRWELPGGATAIGSTVTHVFPTGRHVVTVVGTGSTGEETRVSVPVIAMTLSLSAPPVAGYRDRLRLRGRLFPSFRGRVALLRNGVPVGTAKLRDAGRFRVGTRPRGPATYTVRYRDVVSNAVPVAVRPKLLLRVEGAALVGSRLVAIVRTRPASAGEVRVTVRRNGRPWLQRRGAGAVRLPLDARRTASYRVAASVEPRAGFVAAAGSLTATIRLPTLALGSRGSSVLELERRLSELTYALPRADGFYGWETAQAVLAFQKLNGLSRTGRVDARVWRALVRARAPRARYASGAHIEVDKGRQVLMVVRRGRVVLTTHVSTGATGNTPVGRWRVYRKVVGWDWVLWYPMYFLRGFAIHGYPEVPAYPASHGCVRVPMWLAPRLYAGHGYGTVVYVY